MSKKRNPFAFWKSSQRYKAEIEKLQKEVRAAASELKGYACHDSCHVPGRYPSCLRSPITCDIKDFFERNKSILGELDDES